MNGLQMLLSLLLNRRRATIPFLLFLLLTLGCHDANHRAQIPPPHPRPSKNFPNTAVWPHTEAPLAAGRNYVYCGSFQIAWNELIDKFGNGKQEWLDADITLIHSLNKRMFNRNDIDSSALFTFADKLTADAEVIFNNQLRTKFPNASLPTLPWGSGIPFAYAYLEKQLHFRDIFDRMKPAPFPASANSEVQWFGIDPEFARKGFPRFQVNVLNYSNPHEFVVELLTNSHSDQLLLASIPRPATIAEAIEIASQLIDQGKGKIQPSFHRLAIPIVSFGIERRYDELSPHENKPTKPSTQEIPIARQTIRFRLDEAGSTLRSDAAAPAASINDPRVVDLVFDQPFLLTLRQRESRNPYFALWIENAEILEDVPSPPTKTN